MSEQTGSIQTQRRLRSFLEQGGASFREIEHEPTHTSEQSAAARGESMSIGGKALVMKAGADRFVLLVIPADRKLDSTLLRKSMGKRIRFATRDELDELTGLVPGSVPPFGRPVLPLDLFVDRKLTENDRVAFNAASLTTSFIMPMADYLRIVQPEVLDLSRAREENE
ncbi:MAG: YbaK/EbsC family protein [Planctomycetota bacterium]